MPAKKCVAARSISAWFGGGVTGMALGAVIVGCGPSAPSAVPASASAAPGERVVAGRLGAASAPLGDQGAADSGLAAIGGEALIELAVEGFRAAVVSVPVGAASPQPLLVVAHGAGGRPEPHCAFWRALIGKRGFVLCPRGTLLGSPVEPSEQGFFYRDHHALEREVLAAMAALGARFGAQLDARAPIYGGFSQGATMGALAFVKRPAVFARLVLIEGGVGESDEWTINGARAFREGGGDRVLFACGRPSCFLAAQRTLTYLDKAGLKGRVAHGAGAGHTYGGAVEAEVDDALPWITEGDPRWQER